MKNYYSPEIFREEAHKMVDILADYFESSLNDKNANVYPCIEPDDMVEEWATEFGSQPEDKWPEFMEKLIATSSRQHSPGYVGHQVTAPLPFAAIMDFAAAFMNNSSAVYETAPANVGLEKHVIKWMAEQVGYPAEADGILTSGGTLGNLTALLAARQAKFHNNVWKQGLFNNKKAAVMVSAEAHYSVKRAASVMGLGEDSVILVPSCENHKLRHETLEVLYNKAVSDGYEVFALAGNACSTATGTYDDLEMLAEFCREKNMWFHIDGAHGASAAISDKYKYLMKGAELSDSIVWDAHKMFLMPSLITAVVFRDGSRSYEAFSQEASYLFGGQKPSDEWYNPAHRTMECTRQMMGVKIYASLKTMGTDYFADYVTSRYDLAREFAEEINKREGFELAVEPDSNIVCFRYTKGDPDMLDEMNTEIRQKVLKSGEFYLVQTQLKGTLYLRTTIINPLTQISHLKRLLELIEETTNQ